MYRATGDIYKVSRFLGHSKTTITEQHYAHITTDDKLIAALKAELYRQQGLAKALESRLAA